MEMDGKASVGGAVLVKKKILQYTRFTVYTRQRPSYNKV